MKMDPFIEAEEVAGHSVKRCCELFEVSRAAYYQRRKAHPLGPRRLRRRADREDPAIHDESNGTYGSPRVHHELRQRDVACGQRRVRAVDAPGRPGRTGQEAVAYDHDPRPRGRAGQGPDPAPLRTVHRDRPSLRRRHHLHQHLGRLGVPGDGHRPRVARVVGWALADHMRTELVIDALNMAFANRRPPRGAIFHSDRGCQYTSPDYGELARANGVVSVGRACRGLLGQGVGFTLHLLAVVRSRACLSSRLPMRLASRGSPGVGGSKSRMFLSLAWWETSRPPRCQALMVEGRARRDVRPFRSCPACLGRGAAPGGRAGCCCGVGATRSRRGSVRSSV